MSEIIEQAKKKAKQSYDCWRETFERAVEDLEFLSDDPYCQWDRRDVLDRRRDGKPIIQIDQLSQFVNQVSNDVRMNTPSIEVSPADDGDPDIAEIYEGKIREIQKRSNADDAYDTAVNFAIRSGLGFIRVDHDYADNKSFNQELSIKRVTNPCAVLFDPESVEPDGSDAKCMLFLDKMSKEDFEREYPGKDPASFEFDGMAGNVAEDEICIAEYYYIDETPKWLGITYDGQQVESDKKLSGDEYQYTRQTTSRIVRRCKMSNVEELEKGVFPGDYIPFVPVFGEEAWVDGKRHLISLIRRSKDSQRMYNYWASIETEILMKAPKADVVAVAGTVEDFAEDWTNPSKAAVLRYNQKDSYGQQAAPPQFTPPIQIPVGIVNARQQTTNDIRATMGLYDSFLGQQDNAVSGVAIDSRQQEGDRAVFHFSDNLSRAITQVGRILDSAIPIIYDAPRIVTIIGKEETNDKVAINTDQLLEGQKRPYYLSQGKNNISVNAGANYATLRKEAADFYERVFNSDPEFRTIMGDLLFKYSDLPGASAMEERMKKVIRPEMLDDEMDARTMQAMQQVEQLKQVIQTLEGQMGQLGQALQDKEKELSIKAMGEEYDAREADRKYQIDREKIRLEEQVKAGELAIKQEELRLKAYELGLKTSKVATEQRNNALQTVGQYRSDAMESTQ